MNDHVIEIGGKVYPLLFSTNAASALDRLLRDLHQGNVAELLGRVIAKQPSLTDIHMMMWALIEGGRKRAASRATDPSKARFTPFTLDEVGDMIDDAGGLQQIMDAVELAMVAATPKPSTEDEPVGDEKND